VNLIVEPNKIETDNLSEHRDDRERYNERPEKTMRYKGGF
jgi:hypothetical protein